MLFRFRGVRCVFTGCEFKLVHTALLVAARMAFRSWFPDSHLVARLIEEIYRCDKDLKYLMVGAYHEPKDCFSFDLYETREEGVYAVDYFAYHSNRARKLYIYEGEPRRFVDLSLNIPNWYHPAVYAIQQKVYDLYHVLVQHGADLCDKREPAFKYSVEMRVMSGMGLNKYTKDKIDFRRLFFKVNPHLDSKVGSLLTLARRAIRNQLHANFQLPGGIEELPILHILQRYTNLELCYPHDWYV
nr:uncharacterized protein LOC112211792 [Halyomorpha halys]